MELNELVQAIRDGSVERLRAIPGVGPKTAGRLVLELKEKVALLNLAGLQSSIEAEGGEAPAGDDALSALMNLGYNRNEAKRAVDQILKEQSPSNPPDSVEELIKKALKKLAKVN
jgi:Holliday junction DNA helicase RuvA